MRFAKSFFVCSAGLLLFFTGPISAQQKEVKYADPIVEVVLPYKKAEFISIEAAKLDAQSRKAVQMLAQAGMQHPSYVGLSPLRRREIHDQLYIPLGLPNEDITHVEERFIPGPGGYKIRVRIYTPKGEQKETLPVVLYYHGGGMMVGSLEQYEPIVRRLCQKSDMIVVAVDYRMSPENKFPTAIDDAYAALLWARDNADSFGGDTERLVVAGDSGGGLLAAAMTQIARDENGPALSYQVLVYPAVGTRGNSKSLEKFREGYVFGRSELEWAYGSWVNSPDEMNNPKVQPILAADFSNLPPAYIASAEYEVMRDDIEEYAALLQAAGVPTVLHRFSGTVHPFMSMAGVIDAGKDVIDEAATMIRKGLNLPAR